MAWSKFPLSLFACFQPYLVEFDYLILTLPEETLFALS